MPAASAFAKPALSHKPACPLPASRPWPPSCHVCVQGFDPARSQAIVKGDSKCLCIAAASVIAKVTRDRLMQGYHQQWPLYNFAGGWVGGRDSWA